MPVQLSDDPKENYRLQMKCWRYAFLTIILIIVIPLILFYIFH